MDQLSLGLAFTAGILAPLDPCAIGMLPAYLIGVQVVATAPRLL